MSKAKVLKGNKELFRNAQKDVAEWESLKKMEELFNYDMNREWKEEEKILWWSDGNDKADIPSYSTMVGFTCMSNGKYPPCFTSGNCYALYDMRNSIPLERCVHNTVLIIRFPEKFEESFRLMMSMYPAIRVHVDGDYVNARELEIVDRVRKEFPNHIVLSYTKKYDLANRHMDKYGKIDGNFILEFSEWPDYPMDNRYNMPTSKVYATCEEYIEAPCEQKCGSISINADGTYNFVKGKCSVCVMHHFMKDGLGGCFDLQTGMTVGFLAH